MSPQSRQHPFLEERIGKDVKAEEESNQVDVVKLISKVNRPTNYVPSPANLL